MATGMDLVVNFMGNAKQLEQTVKGVEGTINGVVSFAKSAFGVLAAGFTLQHVIAEAEAADSALSKLTNAVENQGAALGVSVDELTEIAAQLQKTTNFADEATMAAAEVAVSFGNIRGDNLKEMVRLTADVAEGMQVDMKTAAEQVGKALAFPETVTRTMKTLKLTIEDDVVQAIIGLAKEGKTAEAQFLLLTAINETYEGRALAGADATTIQKNSFGELAEALGRMVLPAVKALLPIVKAMADVADELAKIIGALVVVWGLYTIKTKTATVATAIFKAVASGGVGALRDLAIALAAGGAAYVALDHILDDSAQAAEVAAGIHKELARATEDETDAAAALNRELEREKKNRDELARANKTVRDTMVDLRAKHVGLTLGPEQQRAFELEQQGMDREDIRKVIEFEREIAKLQKEKEERDERQRSFHQEILSNIEKQADEMKRLKDEAAELVKTPVERFAEKLAAFKAAGVGGEQLQQVVTQMLLQSGAFEFDKEPQQIRRESLTAIDRGGAVAEINRFNAEMEERRREAEQRKTAEAKANALREKLLAVAEKQGVNTAELVKNIKLAEGIQ